MIRPWYGFCSIIVDHLTPPVDNKSREDRGENKTSEAVRGPGEGRGVKQ